MLLNFSDLTGTGVSNTTTAVGRHLSYRTERTNDRMEAFLRTGKLGPSSSSPSSSSSSKKVPSSSESQSSSSKRRSAPVPWVEKYRPKTVDDVAHQEEVRGGDGGVKVVLSCCLPGRWWRSLRSA